MYVALWSAGHGLSCLCCPSPSLPRHFASPSHKHFTLQLTIIPVLNKIDLQSAQIERSVTQMNALFDVEPEDVIKVSGTSHDNAVKLVKLIKLLKLLNLNAAKLVKCVTAVGLATLTAPVCRQVGP